jgi:Putative phage abortive infection protein
MAEKSFPKPKLNKTIMKKKKPLNFVLIAGLIIATYILLLYLGYVVSQTAFADYGVYTPGDKPCPTDYAHEFENDGNGKKRGICASTRKAKFEAIAKLGPVGDSFGIINSIFGTITLAILTGTLFLQNRQLSEQQQRFDEEKEESAAERIQLQQQNHAVVAASIRQAHDRRVFDGIELHHRMTERVELLIGHRGVYGSRKGVQAINVLFNAILFETGNWLLDANYNPTINQQPGSIDVTAISNDIVIALGACARESKPKFRSEIEKFFRKHRNIHDNEIGHIFRNAYRLLKWINDEPDMSTSARWEYASTFRAQLSFGELSLLLLNCATEETKKAAPLFSRYAMFENIPKNDLLVFAYADDSRFFPEAFDGELAKRQIGLSDLN